MKATLYHLLKLKEKGKIKITLKIFKIVMKRIKKIMELNF